MTERPILMSAPMVRSTSMDDLSRARDTITRCCATLLDASYTDGIPTETTDVWRTIAADARRDLDALTRWRDSLPVGKVARWDAARGAYVAHDNEGDVCMVATERERAIAWGYTIEGGPAEDSPERLPARCGDCKHYDGDRLCKASTGQRFTWGSYEPASWCPLRFAAKADDTAPERLKARREALGWSIADAADACADMPGAFISQTSVTVLEAPAGALRGYAPPRDVRDIYAAALSAEEQRRANPYTTTEIDGATPILPDHKPVPVALADLMDATDVVDVPQPPSPVAKRCGTVLAKHWPGDTIMHIEVDGGGYVRAPVALLRAMLAAIDAQQTAPVQPERPEPRYKVGDWVREPGEEPWQIARADWWPERHCWRYSTARFGYDEADLTPALDSALHETARKTVAACRDGSSLPHGCSALPGYRDGVHDRARWAAQLERLLGDA